MELRQLQYIVAVADTAGFTRAAAQVHVTQSGLSSQVAALERELGQKLFDRGRHGATPTEVGLAVLEHARDALAAADRIRNTVDDYAGLLRGKVRIGFVSGAADEAFDVARVLAEFRHDHPQVHVSLSEDDSDAMVDALAHGRLDIAVIGLTGEELPKGVVAEVILDTAIVAAAADEDTRLPRDRITLADLAEEPLICLPNGTGIRGVFRRACEVAGLSPDVAYEAAAPPVLLRLAAHGLGIALVPELTPAETAAFGVRTLRITDPPLRAQLALTWTTPGNQTPATRVLLGQLRIALAPTDEPVATRARRGESHHSG